jgi:flagellar basal-body rod protein FlgB
MESASPPLFDALLKRMAWLSDRQAVLAQNVANSDTPGYVAHDLKAQDFKTMLAQSTSRVALATTQPNHIALAREATSTNETVTMGDGSINGNRVSLEDEMMKVSQTADDYALVSTVYRANLNMVKTVLGRGS